MTWRTGLFLHFPVDPDRLRPHVPSPLELDTYDGDAYLSVLPFVLADAGLRYSPAATRLTFPEVNVRTYVQYEGESGLYFLDIDVAQRAVAELVRWTTRLPVHPATADVETDAGRVRFRSVRDSDPDARLSVTFGPTGGIFRAEPGSLDHWLAERRRMYDPRGRDVFYADISHERWPLQPAEATVERNTLLEASDLPVPEREPRVRYADGLSLTGSVPRRVDRL